MIQYFWKPDEDPMQKFPKYLRHVKERIEAGVAFGPGPNYKMNYQTLSLDTKLSEIHDLNAEKTYTKLMKKYNIVIPPAPDFKIDHKADNSLTIAEPDTSGAETVKTAARKPVNNKQHQLLYKPVDKQSQTVSENITEIQKTLDTKSPNTKSEDFTQSLIKLLQLLLGK